MQAGALDGMRVLIVEDEMLVALSIEDMLVELGCAPVGISRSVADAIAAIRVQPDIDAAILDVNLGPEQVFPVAEELAQRRIPFLFSTGYGPADLSDRYPGRPVLHKPYRPRILAETLRAFRDGDRDSAS